MIKNVNEICTHIKIHEEWRGLKLFHRCKKCGAEKIVGRIVYYDDRETSSQNISLLKTRGA